MFSCIWWPFLLLSKSVCLVHIPFVNWNCLLIGCCVEVWYSLYVWDITHLSEEQLPMISSSQAGYIFTQVLLLFLLEPISYSIFCANGSLIQNTIAHLYSFKHFSCAAGGPSTPSANSCWSTSPLCCWSASAPSANSCWNTSPLGVVYFSLKRSGSPLLALLFLALTPATRLLSWLSMFCKFFP